LEYEGQIQRGEIIHCTTDYDELHPWYYSHGNTCPVCRQEGIIRPIVNYARLCKHHMHLGPVFAEKAKQQVARLIELSRDEVSW